MESNQDERTEGDAAHPVKTGGQLDGVTSKLSNDINTILEFYFHYKCTQQNFLKRLTLNQKTRKQTFRKFKMILA